jgi:hypothetical protein
VKPKLFPNCKLFIFDRDTQTFGEIDAEKVEVKFINGQAVYYPVDETKNFIIVQALNIKKASARMLSIITKEIKK